MGTDDLHKRAKSKISRQKPTRQPNKVILIVCEGKKTEKNYFQRLKEYLNLTTTIYIVPSAHPDPKQIIKYTKQQKIRQYNEYDEIYCVFDKDSHTLEYVNEVLRMANKNNFKTIVSDPCFEFWILLHFAKITPKFSANKSPCEELQKHKDFKKNLPHYSKDYDFKDIIANHLQTAIKNANEINNAKQTPYTEVVKLVENLQDLAKGN